MTTISTATSRIASIRIDIVTDQYVIEGGLDKRSSLDSIQQAVFASTLTGNLLLLYMIQMDHGI